MKKFIFIIICLFQISVYSREIYFHQYFPSKNLVITNNNQEKFFDFEFNLRSIKLENHYLNSQVFEKISINPLKNSQNINQAELPEISKIFIGMPDDLKIQLDLNRPFEMDNILIRPSVFKSCRCNRYSHSPLSIYRYNENDYFNKAHEYQFISKKTFLGHFKNLPLTKITIKPVKYFPYEKKLLIYPNLKVKIRYKSQQNIDQLLQTQTTNELAIFSLKKYQSEIENIDSIKKSSTVKIYYLPEINFTFSALKDFIKKRYQDSPFTYSLIIGAEEEIPMEIIQTFTDPYTSSDLNLYLLDENDENDLIPDVFYSRLVPEKNGDILRYFNKVKEYNNRKKSSLRGVGIASSEGFEVSDEEYLKLIEKPFIEKQSYQFRNFIEKDKEPDVISKLNREFENGIDWFFYLGHGDGRSWLSLSGDNYEVKHLYEYNPVKIKPIVIDIACDNGKLSLDDRLGVNLINAEIPNKGHSGAIGYYGGSALINWDPPAIMGIGISKTLNESKNPNLTLGEVLFKGQLYLMENFSNLDWVKDNMAAYHLQGDPMIKPILYFQNNVMDSMSKTDSRLVKEY